MFASHGGGIRQAAGRFLGIQLRAMDKIPLPSSKAEDSPAATAMVLKEASLLPDDVERLRASLTTCDVHCGGAHRFAAQTFLGGVLGGNLAFYTMIMSRTRLEVPVQSIKWKRR